MDTRAGGREIVFDIETTGLKPELDRIIEIGCVELIDGVKTGRTFHRYVNPQGRKIDPEAFGIHGISDKALSRAPRFDDIAGDFLEFVGESRLVAHNGREFDLLFVNNMLRDGKTKNPPIEESRLTDTLELSRERYPGQRNRLSDLCERYEIDTRHRTKHSALVDADLLAKVYCEMVYPTERSNYKDDRITVTRDLRKKQAAANGGDQRNSESTNLIPDVSRSAMVPNTSRRSSGNSKRRRDSGDSLLEDGQSPKRSRGDPEKITDIDALSHSGEFNRERQAESLPHDLRPAQRAEGHLTFRDPEYHDAMRRLRTAREERRNEKRRDKSEEGTPSDFETPPRYALTVSEGLALFNNSSTNESFPSEQPARGGLEAHEESGNSASSLQIEAGQQPWDSVDDFDGRSGDQDIRGQHYPDPDRQSQNEEPSDLARSNVAASSEYSGNLDNRSVVNIDLTSSSNARRTQLLSSRLGADLGSLSEGQNLNDVPRLGSLPAYGGSLIYRPPSSHPINNEASFELARNASDASLHTLVQLPSNVDPRPEEPEDSSRVSSPFVFDGVRLTRHQRQLLDSWDEPGQPTWELLNHLAPASPSSFPSMEIDDGRNSVEPELGSESQEPSNSSPRSSPFVFDGVELTDRQREVLENWDEPRQPTWELLNWLAPASPSSCHSTDDDTTSDRTEVSDTRHSTASVEPTQSDVAEARTVRSQVIQSPDNHDPVGRNEQLIAAGDRSNRSTLRERRRGRDNGLDR